MEKTSPIRTVVPKVASVDYCGHVTKVSVLRQYGAVTCFRYGKSHFAEHESNFILLVNIETDGKYVAALGRIEMTAS
jgi:hypothetical protein